MSQSERTVAHILDNSFVRFGTLVSAIFFVAMASWQVSAWFAQIEAGFNKVEIRLGEIEDQLEIGTADRWRKKEMSRWCRETELINDNWTCGEIE